MIEIFEIDAAFETEAMPKRIIDETLRAWNRRRGLT
jgi:hypothetical protein